MNQAITNQDSRSRDSGVQDAAGDIPAYKSRGAWLTLGMVAALGLIADLSSKYAAFHSIAGKPVDVVRERVLAAQYLGNLIPPHEPITIVPKLLNLTLVLNPGAVFGIGAGKRWFFVFFTVAAMSFALWIFGTWTRARDRWAHAAVALVIAGGLGNLYDRVMFACVRDFIHPLPGIEFPKGFPVMGGREVWPYVSNVADLWLLIGIGILIVRSWRTAKAESLARAAAKA